MFLLLLITRMDDPFYRSVEENRTDKAGHLARLLPCARTRAQHCLHGLNDTV